jgi:hypothetical protein
MPVTSRFQFRSWVRLRIGATQSQIEANITKDPDVENADESIAFSLLIQHSENATKEELQVAALKRARDILSPQRCGPFAPRTNAPVRRVRHARPSH